MGCLLWRILEISPGKCNNFHPIYPPDLLREVLGSCWTSFCHANSSAPLSLVSGSCPSDWDFALGFLQIPPHDGHPCLRLVVPATWPTADFHRLAIAHAGRTLIKNPQIWGFLYEFNFLVFSMLHLILRFSLELQYKILCLFQIKSSILPIWVSYQP